MSLFRKKKWGIERSEQNKGLIRQLFNQAMPDGDTWKIVYGQRRDVFIKYNHMLNRKSIDILNADFAFLWTGFLLLSDKLNASAVPSS